MPRSFESGPSQEPGQLSETQQRTPETKPRPPEVLSTPGPEAETARFPSGSPEHPLAAHTLEQAQTTGLIQAWPEKISTPANLDRQANPPADTLAPEPELSDDELLKPSLLQRLGRNKSVRALMGALNLFGVGKGVDASLEAYRNVEKDESVQMSILDVAYGSSLELEDDEGNDFVFEHKLDTEQTVNLDNDNTIKRSDLLRSMNENLTASAENMAPGGLDGLIEHIADTQGPDGKTQIDAFKFYLAYNDQIPMSAAGTELLQAATGLSEVELDSLAEVVRDSVLQMPDVRMGITGRIFYHADQINTIDAEGDVAKLNEARLEQTIDIAREVVKTLDFESMTEAERAQAIEITQNAIRATIDLDNAWTTAANYTGHWNEPLMQASFAASNESQPGMKDKIMEADLEANLALKKLASLEKGPGHLHDLTAALSDNLEDKGRAFFELAAQLDPESDVFKSGLAYYAEPAATLAQTSHPGANSRE
jgi:hypothetical protein